MVRRATRDLRFEWVTIEYLPSATLKRGKILKQVDRFEAQMDPIRTSGHVECQCGWAGELIPPETGESAPCPQCGRTLTAATPAVNERLAATEPRVAGSAEASAGPESGSPQPSSGKAAWDWSRRQFLRAWGYLLAAFAFYWSHRGDLRIGLRRWMLQFLPALEDPDRARRVIRVPLRESERLTVSDETWQFQLPGRCVVCGSRGSGEKAHLEREALDPYPMLVAPLVGILAALFFGWWYQSLLLFLVLSPGGILAGYALRRLLRLNVTFERCRRHAESQRAPEVEAWHDELLLWTGASEVRLAFYGRLPDDVTEADDAAAPYMPPEVSPAPPTERLALADDVPESSRIVHESPERLMGDEDQGDVFGPPATPLPDSEPRLPLSPPSAPSDQAQTGKDDSPERQ